MTSPQISSRMHEELVQMLRTIWPYISDKIHQATLPPIDANSLYSHSTQEKTGRPRSGRVAHS